MSNIKVKGKIRDLIQFARLIPRRNAWIDSGKPFVDGSDPVAEFAREFHPGVFEAVIEAIKEETSTTRTYRIKAAEGYKLPFFYAGQYISIKFEIDGRSCTRPYTISSSPRDSDGRGYLEITLKKKNGGYTSEYISEKWKPGTVIRCDGAFGEMWYHGIRDQKHVVALAGGSGITPFRSIALDMFEGSGRPEKLTILYGSRNQSDIIFQEELDSLVARSSGRIRVIHVLSEPDPGWEGETGFLSAGLIKRALGSTDGKSFFMCGPQAMYSHVNKQLDDLGIIQRFRRQEAYGESDDITAHPEFPREKAGKTYKLAFRYGITEVELECRADETLLVALERAGYAVDSRCRSGECGWCRSLLEKGEIWYRPEGLGVRASDLDDGFVHVCSAYPMSNVVLRVQNQL